MKTIIFAGASGFVCQRILPYLIQEDYLSIVLVGRDPSGLALIYPDLKVCGYKELTLVARGADLLVNMVTLNNDKAADEGEFRAVNLDFAKYLYSVAVEARVKRFCQLSTFQALGSKDRSAYARTKAEAEVWLSEAQEKPGAPPVILLRLAAVHGDREFRGKLGLLMKFPSFIRPLGLQLLSSMRPVAHERIVAGEILAALRENAVGTHLVSTRQDGNLVYAFGKRVVDVSFAVSVIALLWWLLVIIYLAIRFTSRGPGFFVQRRIGLHGEVFRCYKFRTMRLGTPQAGTHEISPSAITPIGRFLRFSKIDELPQVLNLLRLEMSLVGPRPCLPTQTELLEKRSGSGVLKVLPGITGLAQVRGVDMSDVDQLVDFDVEYIARRTLLLDLKLILATACGRGIGDFFQRKH